MQHFPVEVVILERDASTNGNEERDKNLVDTANQTCCCQMCRQQYLLPTNRVVQDRVITPTVFQIQNATKTSDSNEDIKLALLCGCAY